MIPPLAFFSGVYEGESKGAQEIAVREVLNSDGLQELLKSFRLSAESHIYSLEDCIQNYAAHKEETSFMEAGQGLIPLRCQ